MYLLTQSRKCAAQTMFWMGSMSRVRVRVSLQSRALRSFVRNRSVMEKRGEEKEAEESGLGPGSCSSLCRGQRNAMCMADDGPRQN